MRQLWCFLAMLVPGSVAAQERPASLVLNGGFERSGGWSKSANASMVESGRGGQCLLVEGASGVMQEVLVTGDVGTYACSVELSTEGVVPVGGRGYAYAAVYQLNAEGRWVEYKDFAQIEGSSDWKRYDFSFELVPRAAVISLRCGIFNATGKAWFDNWTLVEGEKAYGYSEVASPAAGERPDGVIAVLREQGLPARGAGASPERLGQLLTDAGMKVSYLTAAELGDPRKLSPARYNLVVLPYGQSFPAAARGSMTSYLHLGGSFISVGGYAFNNLLARHGGQWVSEETAYAEKIAEAMEASVLPDGGFEATRDAPVGGTQPDGRWRRDGDICTIVEEHPREGTRCAKVAVRADEPREDRWYLDVRPERGQRYRVSGWVNTEEVTPIGHGFAYMALYEYDAEGELGEWKDFAQVTGTHDWQQFHYDFVPGQKTARLHIKLGLYRATGTAWFDDIRLSSISDTAPQPMNTSTGAPEDGLRVSPSQIGVFDASFPLRRARQLLPGAAQHIFRSDGRLTGQFSGWAAAGVQGHDNARWTELLDARDRFNRKRGAAAALMVNYNGFFSGSMWGYFGVESRDLFDGASPWLDAGFVDLARFMVRGLFLRNLATDLASYEDGEPVRLSVTIENYGSTEHRCHVTFCVSPDGEDDRSVILEAPPVAVAPGSSHAVETTWAPPAFDAGLYQVTATLALGGEVIDEMDTGFVVQRDQVVRAGPELRFRDNYFHLDGQPVFLFGSDTYSNVYRSACESPWTWHLDHAAARDYGFNVYENLQFSNPDYVFTREDWRQFKGMAQLCQRHGLVFMPCQLVGHNVAISDDLLERQAAQCAAYGQHMAEYPGLLYYLNGDFKFGHDDKATLSQLWNQWLTEKYGSPDALSTSWGDEVYGDWGQLAYPPPGPRAWDSTRECDRARFDVWVTRRWVERHVRAVRSQDQVHPITSEYYRRPYGGLDLLLTIDGQDASNIGYFDVPYEDIDDLPLTLRLTDLRMRGKSLGLGEYGVKTHPAWSVENGARGYHIVRTEEEQKRLFMAVAHYALGMGACKVQNWCLRDASERVFPWGVFYPNGRIPKDVACWHRNLSLVWRHFRPKYVAPEISVLLPDNLRLGASRDTGVEVAFNAFRALMGLHADFGVINEHHIEALTDETTLLIWPSPFCPDDACYQKVLQWVRDGGRLLVTGDLSRNWDRKRSRAERLVELCGVEFQREVYGPPTRVSEGAERVRYAGASLTLSPCVETRPAGAEVLAATGGGVPALLSHAVGAGRVLYCTDPLEMGDAEQVVPSLRGLYRLATGSAAITEPPAAESAGPDVHICRQPLQSGGEFVMAFNTRMPPGATTVTLPAGDADVRVRLAARYPAMTATKGRNILVALGASGQAQLDGRQLISGDAQVIYLSLDGRALPVSQAVLLAPFSTGRTRLHSRRAWDDPVVLVGDVEGGQWRTFETRPGRGSLALDKDTMTCLMLICEREAAPRWTEAVSQAVRHPEEVRGY
jgi:hypothetical protein